MTVTVVDMGVRDQLLPKTDGIVQKGAFFFFFFFFFSPTAPSSSRASPSPLAQTPPLFPVPLEAFARHLSVLGLSDLIHQLLVPGFFSQCSRGTSHV